MKLSLSTPEPMAGFQRRNESELVEVADGTSSPLSSLPATMPLTPTTSKRESGKLPPASNDEVHQPNQDIMQSTLVGTKRKRAQSEAPKARKVNKVTKTPYYGDTQQDRPEPYGQPLVWAETRQALCETLPYYKAHQSGAYTNNHLAFGFMCDKEVGDRDVFTDQVMIARVGGSKTLDESSGQMQQTKSQETLTPVAKAFIGSMEKLKPVAVIAGQSNRISPVKLPHYYNVLDWFHVTDMWCEKYNGLLRWMVRLEKINLDEKSWWSAKHDPHSPPNFKSPEAKSRKCDACKKVSKVIYRQGWACLNAGTKPMDRCERFFEFDQDIDDKTLEFSPEFLQERTDFYGKNGKKPGSLAPPLLTDQGLAKMGAYGFEEQCKKGIVCPHCGCCSRRVEWRQWRCENKGCRKIYSLTQRPISASLAVSYGIPYEKLKKSQQEFVFHSILSRDFLLGGFAVFEYTIPGVNDDEVIGYIRHYKSNAIINEQPGGPNDIFEELQACDLGLMRGSSKNKGSRNEMLTAHWTKNWGAAYKYHVDNESTTFKQAPSVIIKALKRSTWAGKETVLAHSEQFQPFNELLSVGYFEQSHMGYHDDGEKTLGPTVASISLGCNSTMTWRPKAKNSIGKGDKDQLNNAKGTKKDYLRIVLEHGDMMVMHGRQIQELYEHSVTPHGKLRFALTSRYIDPEKVDEQKRQSVIDASELPEGNEQYDYNGDIDATAVMEPAPNQQ